MKRLAYLDNAKAFAILLVVIGHAIQYTYRETFSDNLIFNVIYSFHMPLFMVISGFFFQSCLSHSFAELLKKKFMTLIFPAIIWSTPKIIFSSGSITEILIYNIWFLKSCFLCYLFYYVCTKVSNLYISFLLLTTISLLIPLDFLPGNLNVMLPFFGLGIIMKNTEVIEKNNVVLDMFFPLFYLVLYCMIPVNCISIPYGCVTLCEGTLTFDMDKLLIQSHYLIMAAFAVISLMRLFHKVSINNKVISFIGANTLAIYLLNNLFCDIFSHIMLPDLSSIAIIICITITQMIAYPLFVYYTNDFRVLRAILWGKFDKNKII